LSKLVGSVIMLPQRRGAAAATEADWLAWPHERERKKKKMKETKNSNNSLFSLEKFLELADNSKKFSF